MYHDTKIEPDLSRPTAYGLVWLLRHPEKWPKDFEFSYARCTSCAIGLARKMWPDQIGTYEAGVVGAAIGIHHTDANHVFMGGFARPGDFIRVSADDVADALEARLLELAA